MRNHSPLAALLLASEYARTIPSTELQLSQRTTATRTLGHSNQMARFPKLPGQLCFRHRNVPWNHNTRGNQKKLKNPNMVERTHANTPAKSKKTKKTKNSYRNYEIAT